MPGAGDRLEVVKDRGDSRLASIGTLHVRPSRIPVLRVKVVGARLRVGILNLVAGRVQRIAVSVAEEADVSCAEIDEVGARTAHDALVIVIAHRIVVGDELEHGRIAPAHIEEAHRQPALECAAGSRSGREVLRTGAGCLGYPDEQVHFPFVHLLPHLKEPVDRVARERELERNVACDLERPVGQIGRKPRVCHVLGLPEGVGAIRLRQGRVGSGRRGTDGIGGADRKRLSREGHLQRCVKAGIRSAARFGL